MDKIDLLKAADDLKAEASKFIYSSGLDNILNSFGRVFYTGSYFLDVMVWPDLDIEILLNGDPYSVKAFFQLGSEIEQLPEVKSMKFHNFLNPPGPESIPPKGLYWKIQAERPGKQNPWKIDLWSFEKDVLEKNRKKMEDFAARIDEDKRKRIIQLKHSLLTSQGRTPVFSGYHIYQAVLIHNILKRPDVINFLRNHGVVLEE